MHFCVLIIWMYLYLHFSFMALGMNTPIFACHREGNVKCLRVYSQVTTCKYYYTDGGLNSAAGFLEPCILRENRQHK